MLGEGKRVERMFDIGYLDLAKSLGVNTVYGDGSQLGHIEKNREAGLVCWNN